MRRSPKRSTVRWFMVVATVSLLAAGPEIKGWGLANDPDGHCRFEPGDGKLRIQVPSSPYKEIPGKAELHAPTILSPVRGEFVAIVQVGGDLHPGPEPSVADTLPYNAAGLILWVDPRTYIRIERAGLIKNGAFLTYANFEHFSGGRRASSQAAQLKDLPTSLRLERRGGRIYASASQDGTNWTSFPPLEVSLPEEVKIGVLAVNTSTRLLNAELTDYRVFTRKEIEGQ